MDGRAVRLTTGRLRTLLVVLAISAGRAVSMDRLAAAVWGDELPGNARRSLQTYAGRLRAEVGGAQISTQPAGIALSIDPGAVDALRFETLVDAAAREPDPDREYKLLTEALNLWRGDPFDGVASRWLAETEAPRLVERHLSALERRIDLDLAAGRHAELAGELTEWTARHPMRESLWLRLLTVLDLCGRRADALERYHQIRLRIADELGVDPNPELQRLYADLLTDQPATARVAVPRQASVVLPHQLPAPLPAFTGRTSELRNLDRLIDHDALVITAINGTAGVGKTALAVHWAHKVADRFPDGQLYVDLRGFGPTDSIMDPDEVVRGFLDALAVPPQRIPASPEAQAGLYRSLLAGRRMLIVLDNARDAEQVRPLLPGEPGCLVVVTSRNQLSGLVAVEGAHPLILDVLTTDEARQFLAARLGPHRIAAEPQAAQEIIALCARLPLALAIVAARAATHPDFPLAALPSELKDTHHRLDALTGQDPTTDVRAVFSWSYHTLTSNAARLFRLLGLHPGPDIAAPAAASLAGTAPDATRAMVAELTRASLLIEHTPGRYTFHDLLRSYATQLAHAIDDDQQRHAATGRMLDHYLHTAHTADRMLYLSRDPIGLTPPRPGVTPEHATDYPQALGWFTAEHRVLLAAIDHATATGFDTHTWQLTWTLWTFLERRGHWHDLVSTGWGAVAAAQRLADPTAQARAYHTLGSAYMRLKRFDDADTQLRHALDLAIQAGDKTWQARTHHSMGYLRERQGRPAQALDYARQALHLFRAAGHQVGQARALNSVGWCHTLLGDHQQAITCCRQALTLMQDLGDRSGQAGAWNSLGHAHYQLGHHTQAISCYQHSLTLDRDLSDRYHEADTLTRLGDTHHAAGNPQTAHDTWQQALAILDDLDHPDADHVRAKLTLQPNGRHRSRS